MNDIKSILNIGRALLSKNGIDVSEARLLLSYVLNVKQEDLIKIDTCPEEVFAKFLAVLEKRVNGVPYAYITSHKEFMGIDFIVNKDVLIPRGDTEVLVEEAIKLDKKKILDMCTGSGCIAISLYKNIKDCDITAVDISEKALDVAKENAKNNNADINFVHSNLFENVKEKFDLIVSNPPYIKTSVIDTLQLEVKMEPVIALDGGESGVEFYEKIINSAPDYLHENGILMFEIGYDEADTISLLLQKYFENIFVIKDLSGNDRVVKAILKERRK